MAAAASDRPLLALDPHDEAASLDDQPLPRLSQHFRRIPAHKQTTQKHSSEFNYCEKQLEILSSGLRLQLTTSNIELEIKITEHLATIGESIRICCFELGLELCLCKLTILGIC